MRLILSLPIIILSSCQTLHFYTQGIRGQVEILQKSQPNSTLLASATTPDALKKQLTLAGELCAFATANLDLPGNSAYQRYADLGRTHVVYVIHAAPEFSLKAKTWRYPFLGELDYRGYFKESDAKDLSRQLESAGYEVFIGGTDAYSTLGLFHDPLLNTFIDYPEIDLAETIFHELTHRRIFRNGDTTFNESLATAVAEEGVRRWLGSQNRTAALADYEARLVRRREFFDEIAVTRRQLDALYASGLSRTIMRQRKAIILTNLKHRSRDLQQRWGGKRLNEWLKLDLTNAHLVALISYHQDIPKFKQLLAGANGDFTVFFKRAGDL
ncbi:MAG: aminopeptidase [Armatimonadetes bacterium]|nr:aminopeptidase [Akkermansiaceae bacterium]